MTVSPAAVAVSAPSVKAPVCPNVKTIVSIGAATVKTERVAQQIVVSAPVGYDWAARGAVTAQIHAWAVGADGEVPAQKTGPKGAQKATNYGRGVDALAKAIRAILSGDDDEPKPAALRATLSGEGGGSITVDMTSDLGIALIALIQAQSA